MHGKRKDGFFVGVKAKKFITDVLEYLFEHIG